MSAQTTVARAAEAWAPWMRRWPHVEALAGASLADVLAQWQGLGYPRRARDLHRSARIVTESGWPEDLTELPGVGPYVAAAIRCFAREEPVLPLDVNVKRVLGAPLPRRPRHLRGSVAGRSGDDGVRPADLLGPTPCVRMPGARGLHGRRRPRAARGHRVAGSRSPAACASVAAGYWPRVIADGGVRVEDADREAAAGLADDGLVVLAGGRVLPPQ